MSDRIEDVSIDELGERDLDERASTEEPAKTKFVEFVGTDPRFGVEFYPEGRVGHTVLPRDVKDAWGVEIPKKIEWTKAAGGPHKGRMLAPAEGLSDEALESFNNDPMFKVVEL